MDTHCLSGMVAQAKVPSFTPNKTLDLLVGCFVLLCKMGLERVGIGDLQVGEFRVNRRQKVDTYLLLPRRDSNHEVAKVLL